MGSLGTFEQEKRIIIEDIAALETLRTITQRLEICSDERIKHKLRQKEVIRGYWGTGPTGKPHIGYLVPLVKIAECINAGVDFVLLIADSYGFLVGHNVSLEVVAYRSQYYAFLLTAILKALGVDGDRISIMLESEYSMTPSFWKDSMRLSTLCTQKDIKSVGLEVISTQMFSPLLCPIHQALSEVYTASDFQLGGLDQCGMFAYADRFLPQMGYTPSDHLAAGMIPSLDCNKMSSSAAAETKIMFLDSHDEVESKLARADVKHNNPERNAILGCAKHIVFPVYQMGLIESGCVELKQSDGTTKAYTAYEALEEDLISGRADISNLTSVVSRTINRILESVRLDYATNKRWQEIERLSYDGVTNDHKGVSKNGIHAI